jgi:hypothetical protein
MKIIFSVKNMILVGLRIWPLIGQFNQLIDLTKLLRQVKELNTVRKDGAFFVTDTHGAGRSSRWPYPFVIFSSSPKENFSAISIRTYL